MMKNKWLVVEISMLILVTTLIFKSKAIYHLPKLFCRTLADTATSDSAKTRGVLKITVLSHSA